MHAGRHQRAGVLYVAATEASEANEERLFSNRMVLSLIATEVLGWWRRHLADEHLNGITIDQLDRDILGYVYKGFPKKSIASFLGVSVSRVEGRCRKINEALGTREIAKASREAIRYGLLRLI